MYTYSIYWWILAKCTIHSGLNDVGCCMAVFPLCNHQSLITGGSGWGLAQDVPMERPRIPTDRRWSHNHWRNNSNFQMPTHQHYLAGYTMFKLLLSDLFVTPSTETEIGWSWNLRFSIFLLCPYYSAQTFHPSLLLHLSIGTTVPPKKTMNNSIGGLLLPGDST